MLIIKVAAPAGLLDYKPTNNYVLKVPSQKVKVKTMSDGGMKIVNTFSDGSLCRTRFMVAESRR